MSFFDIYNLSNDLSDRIALWTKRPPSSNESLDGYCEYCDIRELFLELEVLTDTVLSVLSSDTKTIRNIFRNMSSSISLILDLIQNIRSATQTSSANRSKIMFAMNFQHVVSDVRKFNHYRHMLARVIRPLYSDEFNLPGSSGARFWYFVTRIPELMAVDTRKHKKKPLHKCCVFSSAKPLSLARDPKFRLEKISSTTKVGLTYDGETRSLAYPHVNLDPSVGARFFVPTNINETRNMLRNSVESATTFVWYSEHIEDCPKECLEKLRTSLDISREDISGHDSFHRIMYMYNSESVLKTANLPVTLCLNLHHGTNIVQISATDRKLLTLFGLGGTNEDTLSKVILDWFDVPGKPYYVPFAWRFYLEFLEHVAKRTKFLLSSTFTQENIGETDHLFYDCSSTTFSSTSSCKWSCIVANPKETLPDAVSDTCYCFGCHKNFCYNCCQDCERCQCTNGSFASKFYCTTKSTRDLLNKDSVRCPKKLCGQVYSRTEGCNHMICPQCKTHFCFLCGKDFSNETMDQHYSIDSIFGQTCTGIGKNGSKANVL